MHQVTAVRIDQINKLVSAYCMSDHLIYKWGHVGSTTPPLLFNSIILKTNIIEILSMDFVVIFLNVTVHYLQASHI